MSALHRGLYEWSVWLWPLVAGHLWQATIFTMLAAGAALLLRGAPARARYAVWLIASLKFALPAALLAWPARLAGLSLPAWLSAPAHAQLAASYVQVGALTPDHHEVYCAISLLWLAGCGALVAAWWARRHSLLRILRAGRRAAAGRELAILERVRARLGVARAVGLVITRHRIEPGVWRTARPVVVLPEGLAEQLTDAELEAVMLHELAHVRRRDNLVGNAQMWLCCLFWFHPLVWLIKRRLTEERERACDEMVLMAGGAAAPYASGILKVVRFCCGWGVAGVSGAAGSHLRRRVEEIMSGNVDRKRLPWHGALVGTLACGALALSLVAGLSIQGGPAYAAPAASDGAQAKQTPEPERGGAREGEVEGGGLISAPDPVYPPEAKRRRISGRVAVEIVIDEEGRVTRARATSGPEELHAASEDAASRARFHPTKLDGKPVKVTGRLSYNFVLD